MREREKKNKERKVTKAQEGKERRFNDKLHEL